MDSKPKAACCGSAPFQPAPRRQAQEDDVILKSRWSVTLPNNSVKRFQSEDGAQSYADLYNGVVTGPKETVDADVAAGEPVTRRETKRQKAERLAAEAADQGGAGIPPPTIE